MKYVILADSDNTQPFVTPRQLSIVNGEVLIERTVRLLKENGIKDIIVTSHDKRFDNLGATRYEPLYNDYKPRENKGYWVSAFPIELLNEPVCFLFGDVYYSEEAIKTIVNGRTDFVLFFCTYKNDNEKYPKQHDEPLAFKVANYIMFKEHIERVKTLYDKGQTVRHPIAWELYRVLNGINVNEHKMTTNYVAINDESCDIDTLDDIININKMIGGKCMIKCEVIKEFTLEKFDELKNIVRRSIDTYGKLYVGDVFECEQEMSDYLMGKNDKGIVVVKILEIIPEKKKEEAEEKIVGEIEYLTEPKELKIEMKLTNEKPKTNKKKKNSKK